MTLSTRGGVILRTGETLSFVAADVAVKVAPMPEVAPVPGAPPELLGIALVEGELVPVVSIGASRSALVVCNYLGELVALVGAEPLATGTFDVDQNDPDAVFFGQQRVPAFELAVTCARLQGPWVRRWGA